MTPEPEPTFRIEVDGEVHNFDLDGLIRQHSDMNLVDNNFARRVRRKIVDALVERLLDVDARRAALLAERDIYRRARHPTEPVREQDVDPSKFYWVVEDTRSRHLPNGEPRLVVAQPWRSGNGALYWDGCGTDEGIRVLEIVAVAIPPERKL